jgi:diadenosine tetraphosphate (Ap4A) HIT family hydrolase
VVTTTRLAEEAERAAARWPWHIASDCSACKRLAVNTRLHMHVHIVPTTEAAAANIGAVCAATTLQ